jgi:hypothetical protein
MSVPFDVLQPWPESPDDLVVVDRFAGRAMASQATANVVARPLNTVPEQV